MKKVAIPFITVLFASTSLAGNAVSEANGKFDVMAGNVNSSHTENLAASFTAPLADHFGLQLDGLVGQLGESQQHGAAGHVFWRDSDKGLLGLVATHLEVGSEEVNLGGVETEAYWSNTTISLLAAEQAGDQISGLYSSIAATYYLSSDLALSAGYRRLDNLDRQFVEIEYLVSGTAVSVYAEVSSGQADYDHALVGVRYYLASMKNLKRHHREDDPRSILGDINSEVQEFNESIKRDELTFHGSSFGLIENMNPVPPSICSCEQNVNTSPSSGSVLTSVNVGSSSSGGLMTFVPPPPPPSSAP